MSARAVAIHLYRYTPAWSVTCIQPQPSGGHSLLFPLQAAGGRVGQYIV